MGFRIKTRELTSIPVIGWESKKCNANIGTRIVIFSERGSITKDVRSEAYNAVRGKMFLSNAGKVLGAFPLMTGQIVGLARIITTMRDNKTFYGNRHPLLNKSKHIVRGITEFAGLGFVWLVLDVVATAGRLAARIERV